MSFDVNMTGLGKASGNFSRSSIEQINSDDMAVAKIVDRVLNFIGSLDDSQKLNMHGPYRTVMTRIGVEFERELFEMAKQEAKK